MSDSEDYEYEYYGSEQEEDVDDGRICYSELEYTSDDDEDKPNDGNERTKISSNEVLMNISDLPDIALAAVASYLPKPSRALFAVAMMAPSSSWQKFIRPSWMSSPSSPWRSCNWKQQVSLSYAIKAILSASYSSEEIGPEHAHNHQSWEVLDLDFGEIEAAFAAKLTDNDLGAILVCIDGKKTLETLKITGCVNIAGSGMEPLRGSSVLKQLDLSLVAPHKSLFIPEPMISETVVVPILESIIETRARGNLFLGSFQFPVKWHEGQVLDSFLRRCNIQFRSTKCSKCSTLSTSLSPWFELTSEVDFGYGVQANVCYKCTNYFCDACAREGDERHQCLGYCKKSGRMYCQECCSTETLRTTNPETGQTSNSYICHGCGLNRMYGV